MEQRTPCNRYDKDGNLVPKKVFSTFDKALRRAREVNLKRGKTEMMVAYKCPICSEFHIGHNGEKITDKYRKAVIPKMFSIKVVGKIDLDELNKRTK